jgi:hypothetical protein
MKNTKRLKIFLIVLIILISPLLFYKLQGTRIHRFNYDTSKIGDNYDDYFIIQNPPTSEEDLIKLIEKMNDTLQLENTKDKTSYYQRFYKETFHLNRFFKPYYDFWRNYIDVRSDQQGEFRKERLAIYYFKNNDEENKYDASPNYPYYEFFLEVGTSCYYYPKGIKSNPNSHWEKIR